MNLCRTLVCLICLTLGLPAAAFDLQGHRGTRGHAPENTLPAFERALQIGVSTLVPRDGTHMPTLAALFDRVKALDASDVRFNIETKINPGQPEDTAGPETMVNALLKVVRDAGMMQRVSIQSFDWRTLRLVRQLEPSIPTVCLTTQTANNDNLRDGNWTDGLKFADYGSAPRMAKAAG